MKKQLSTTGITNELSASVFFPKPSPVQTPYQTRPSVHRTPSEPTPPLPATSTLSSTTVPSQRQLGEGTDQNDSATSQRDRKTDVIVDVMTSARQDVNLKEWQELIENTETQNSALRLTKAERYAVEDVVNELRRQYGIKTSMNEIARLGLLLLIHDFKQHKQASMIHRVKKM